MKPISISNKLLQQLSAQFELFWLGLFLFVCVSTIPVVLQEHDGYMAQKNKVFVSGKDGYTITLPPMVYSVCKTSNVRTKEKCRTCDERIPSWLLWFQKQASAEQQSMRYESSLSDESMDTVSNFG